MIECPHCHQIVYNGQPHLCPPEIDWEILERIAEALEKIADLLEKAEAE